MEFWEDYETLRIETPEGLDLYLPLAGFGPRFLAFLIDMALVTVVQVLVGAVAVFSLIGYGIGASPASAEPPIWLMVALIAVVIVVIFFGPVLYFMLFESIWAGQSPGKRTAGIRVIRRGGFPAGRREIVWRNVLRLVDYMPSNWFVGLVSFFATRNQQRIGDLLADTVVVREFAGRRPVTSPFIFGESRRHDLPQAAAGALTPQVTYAIQSYLQRATDLDAAAREALSLRCIAALGYSGAHLSLQQREGYLASVAQSSWGTAR